MEKNQFEKILDTIKDVSIKTVSSLRELLQTVDANAAAPASGSLNARGRIEAIFDKGTFMESGAYIRRRANELCADSDAFEGVICGWGSVDGRLVFAFSQDYARTQGALTEAHAEKITEIYRLAIENGAPVIGIFDSAGAYLPEGVRALAGYSKVMNCAAKASGVIPQIAVVPGVCAGSAAVIAGMFDFIVMSEKNSSLSFNAPFAVGNEVGTSDFAAKSGMAALCGADDADCIAKAKLLLSYLPMNNMEGTVEERSRDDANRLCDLTAYKDGGDVSLLISAVADEGRFIELYKDFAPEMACGFVSMNGTVCGVAADRKSVDGGVLSADAARKAARLVSFCDSFDIPVISVLDSAGPDVSAEAEASPYAAELAKLAFAYANAKCPMITVIAGEAYGAHFALMGAKALGADVVLALEGAKTGAMSADRAVAFLWNDQITAEVSRESLEKKWNETVASPVSAAACGAVDDIVADSELRQRICAAVMMLSAKSKCAPARRHANMPL